MNFSKSHNSLLISVNGVFITLKQRSLFLVHGKIRCKNPYKYTVEV